jgi:hypothetical protein
MSGAVIRKAGPAVAAAVALAAGLAGLAALTADCRPVAAAEPAARVIVAGLDGKAYELATLPAGKPTLLFVCDPTLTKCREGAVHFDTQAARIERSGIRPVCVLLADPETARQAAQRLGLAVPVYVDATRSIPSIILGQEILPAMVLLNGRGEVAKVVLGGGESLDGNLTRVLESGKHSWRFLYVLIPLAVFGIILLVG